MKNIIGTLILVDAIGIIRDYCIPTPLKKHENIPEIDLGHFPFNRKHVLMITQKKFVESGMGSPNLTINAYPGDEIRWWVENTNSQTNMDIKIKAIYPEKSHEQLWKTIFYTYPQEIQEIQNYHLMIPPYFSDLKQFWSANHVISKYRAVSKPSTILNKTHPIAYTIELQIIINQNHWQKKTQLCNLKMHSFINFRPSLEIISDNPETFKDQALIRSVNRDFLVSN